ncbi:MAG: hypothetical protein B6I20_10015 [Bacteroidetes bacterium 4572_117]|nr:MAG: hypothetical protein B6I20_10015 [Bacteroidetes bacterium 4572_117]
MKKFHLKTGIIILALSLMINQYLLAQLTIDEIVSKHLDVVGFHSDEQSIKSVEIIGNFTQNNFKFPIKMWAIMPDHLHLNMVYNGLNFLKSSNGKTDWEYNPMKDTLQVKNGEPGEADDFYSRWTGGLTEFRNGKVTGKLLGIFTVEDIDTYKLKVQKADKTRIYYIDKLSYILIRVDDDEDAKKTTYYSDYKKVNSLLLPHKMEGFESGKLTILMEFDTIKVNIPINKDLFKVPTKE